MSRLFGSKNTDIINGLAHEFVGTDVTTTDTTWRDRQGGLNLVRSSSAFTNTLNYIYPTLSGGTITIQEGLLKSPGAKQKVLCVLSADLANAINNIEIGDSNSGQGFKLSANSQKATTNGTNFQQLDAFVTVPAGDKLTMALTIDQNAAAANQCAKYLYNTSGTKLEQVGSSPTGAGIIPPFDLSADQDFDWPLTSPSFGLSSICLFYFDELPDDLEIGLAWMAANPTIGAYAPWRYRK